MERFTKTQISFEGRKSFNTIPYRRYNREQSDIRDRNQKLNCRRENEQRRDDDDEVIGKRNEEKGIFRSIPHLKNLDSMPYRPYSREQFNNRIRNIQTFKRNRWDDNKKLNSRREEAQNRDEDEVTGKRNDEKGIFSSIPHYKSSFSLTYSLTAEMQLKERIGMIESE